MKILLLDKTETVFTVITDALEATEVQEINTAFTLSATLKLTKDNQSALERAVYAAVPITEDETNKFHLYSIQSFKNSDNTLEITGIEQAYDELAGYGYLKEFRQEDKPLKDLANIVFNDTRWQVGTCPVLNSTVYIYYISRLEALKKIVTAYGVEVQFVYTVANSHITKRTVNFYSQIGKDTGRRYVYGTNALSVVREENRVELFTAAVGRGKGIQTTDDTGEATGGFSRKIGFSDVVWSKANGNPVDKPAGQEWVELPEATAIWGYPDGVPRTTILEFSDIDDPNQLLQATYDKLVELARPKVQFNASVAVVGGAGLGDRAAIIRHDLDIKYKARIFKLTRDLLDEHNNSVDIGDYLVKTQPEREEELQNSIGQVEDNVNTTLDQTVSDVTGQLDEQKTDFKQKIIDINNSFDEQTRQNAEAIQAAVEEFQQAVKENVDEVKSQLAEYVGQNSNGPITLYDENGNVIKGVPKIGSLKGNGFELNSSGFNFGGRLIGGDGTLYADGIYGNELTGTIINGGTINGGEVNGVTFTGATFDGKNYFRSAGSGGVAVLSGDHGLSFGNSAIGADSAKLPNTVIWGNLTVHGAIWADETIKSGKAA